MQNHFIIFVHVKWLYNQSNNESFEDWRKYWSVNFNGYGVKECTPQDFDKLNPNFDFDEL